MQMRNFSVMIKILITFYIFFFNDRIFLHKFTFLVFAFFYIRKKFFFRLISQLCCSRSDPEVSQCRLLNLNEKSAKFTAASTGLDVHLMQFIIVVLPFKINKNLYTIPIRCNVFYVQIRPIVLWEVKQTGTNNREIKL